MHTTLLLVRNGATDWNRDRRLHGRRDIALSAAGQAQAHELAERLRALEPSELLSSPLPRAVETAEAVAASHGLQVARDPRLTDFDAGPWESKRYEELQAVDSFRRFMEEPREAMPPGQESLEAVRRRMLASVEQALVDNELGATVIVISHAGPLRVLLAHYLGMDLASYARLRLAPAGIAVVRFNSVEASPRVLAINCGDVRTVLY